MRSALRTFPLILLLAASMLLMQSYAVWHDAEHPFHDHVAECDRLNLISHQAASDQIPPLVVSTYPARQIEYTTDFTPGVVARTTTQPTIRGPPVHA